MISIDQVSCMRRSAFLCKRAYYPHKMRRLHKIRKIRMVTDSDRLRHYDTCPFDWYIMDNEAKSLRYLVIRGSSYGVEHWKINLDVQPTPWFNDMSTHKGSLTTTHALLSDISPMFESRSMMYRFIGHSSGGNIALLCALELVRSGVIHPSQVDTVDSFGAPAILSGDSVHSLLSDLGMDSFNVRNVFMSHDVVPRLLSNNYAMVPRPIRKMFFKDGHVHTYKFIGNSYAIQPDVSWHAFCKEHGHVHHPSIPAEQGVYHLDNDAQLEHFLKTPHPVSLLLKGWNHVIDYHKIDNTCDSLRRILATKGLKNHP